MAHGTMDMSAALTFYTLISLVPVLALVFAVVKSFGLAESLVENLYSLLPQMPEVVDYVVDFATKALARTRGGLMATVSLVTLFWAVIRMFESIEANFNKIWEVKSTRNLVRKYSDYITVVIIAPLLWIVATSIGSYAREMLGVDGSVWLQVGSKVLSLLVVCAMFTLIYMVIPNCKVRLHSATLAGLMAGTCFFLFQALYVYLIKWMTSYNAIYGSFAALPLFLLWVQISWQILLIGGELSFAFQNITRFGEEHEWQRISYDQRRKVMLATMLIIVRHFQSRGGALSAAEIRRELNLPTRIINDVLFQLTKAGQLIDARKNEDEREASYAPAYDIAQMSIYGVLSAVENHGDNPLEFDTESDLKRVEEILDGMKQDSLTSPRNVRLIDLLR